MSFDKLLCEYQARVEQALDACLTPATILPVSLHEAMRYAVLGGGKRLRAALVYATGATVGADSARLDAPACAVEMIHAYSLVHDDLPAMDDDDLRRGKPTCHKAFGEATAILAGDALHSLAFHVLTQGVTTPVDALRHLQMIETLTQAIGSRGMAGGQVMDLAAQGNTIDLAELEMIHICKTGALIRASVMLGANSKPDVAPEVLNKLDHYAKCIGLAFQIHDDILDVEGDTAMLGKTQGADLARNKPTYPAMLGMTRAKQMAQELHDQAQRSLEDLDDSDTLRALASYIVMRTS
jgi:farnesyl diphosphate synthase